jgi:hypothetical protein
VHVLVDIRAEKGQYLLFMRLRQNAYPFVYKETACCSGLLGSVTGASGRPGVLETKLMTSNWKVSFRVAVVNGLTYPEPISAFRAPEVDHVMYSVTDLGVIPVEVRLGRREDMQI